MQQNQSGGSGLSLGDPLLRLNSSPTRAASLASNDDNDASSVIAQAGDIYEERSGGPNLRGMVCFLCASQMFFLPYYVFSVKMSFKLFFRFERTSRTRSCIQTDGLHFGWIFFGGLTISERFQ